jgi:hypothetical protein
VRTTRARWLPGILAAAALAACGEDDRAARRAREEAREAVDAAKDYLEEKTPRTRAEFRERLDVLRARIEELRARARVRMAEGEPEARAKVEGVVRDLEHRYAALEAAYRRSEANDITDEVAHAIRTGLREIDEALRRGID